MLEAQEGQLNGDGMAATANEMLVKACNIYAAIRKGCACVTCWTEDKDDGWRMEVPAHWEYINTNIEEKDDKYD